MWIVFCGLGLAQAQIHDRMSAFGNSFVLQSHSQNTNKTLSQAYQFDWLFFLDRTTAFNLAWNIGVDDQHRHSVSLGINKYFGRYTEISPFIQGHFSFLYSPVREIGWFAGLGLEWNLRRWTKNDNLRVNTGIGFSQWIINNSEDIYRVDLLKLGMGWHF
ncbi:hypothetical protein MRY82_03940 [bacterium]|nr:hypothetical protein [bacterium]